MAYATLLVFLAAGLLFGVIGLAVNRLLMPYRPNRIKNSTYECGIEPTGDARLRFNTRFYSFALMYVVFAAEAAFLFPWAAVFRQLAGLRPLLEVAPFLLVLGLALVYAWNKGALKWD